MKKKSSSQCIPSENIEAALEKLKNAGLKITSIRKLVLEFLTHDHGPFSVEEIHFGIENSRCNLTTIYRTISHLEEIGIVRRSDLGDGVARYEYHCEFHPHHHLICRSCKKVEMLNVDLFSDLNKIARKKGFAEINQFIEIFGLCRDCNST